MWPASLTEICCKKFISKHIQQSCLSNFVAVSAKGHTEMSGVSTVKEVSYRKCEHVISRQLDCLIVEEWKMDKTEASYKEKLKFDLPAVQRLI